MVNYEQVAGGSPAFFKQERGLIAVWGKESVQFLNGMITNDAAKLEDGGEMLAAFPNAQGRLNAIVRVKRESDRFLIETEAATREKVHQNLFRFTFAGDFFVEDLSEKYDYFSTFNYQLSNTLSYVTGGLEGLFLPTGSEPTEAGAIDGKIFETLRIERGVPLFGFDCDETTIVPELGLDGLISYNKGCYIGQEIIARIHFRGHVAKRLQGLTLSDEVEAGTELKTMDDKPAGKITSVTYSPRLESHIALAYVRYDYLKAGTELVAGFEDAVVTDLPFVKPD